MIECWKNKSINLVIENIGILSAVWGFLSAFNTPQNPMNIHMALIFILLFICNGILFVVFHMENKALRNRIFIGMAAVLVLVGVLGASLLSYSMRGLINSMDVGLTFSESMNGMGAILYGVIVLCVLESIFIEHHKYVAAIIMNVSLLLIPIFLGKMPGALPVVFQIVFITGMLALPKNHGKRSWLISVQAMAVTVVVCFVILLFVPQRNFKQWRIFENVRNQFTKSMEKEEQLQEYQMTSGGVNGGTIGGIDEISYSHEVMLTLKTGTTGSVYLKGFVGNSFANNQWRDLTNAEYQTEERNYKELFDTFSMNDMNPSLQTANLLSAVESSKDTCELIETDLTAYLSKILRRKFTVYYEKEAQLFAFIPYGSLYSVQKKSSYDGYYLNEKPSITSYAYEVCQQDYDFWKNLMETYDGDNERLRNYIGWEKQYREFVYDFDTQLTDQEKSVMEHAAVPVPAYTEDGTMAGVLAYAAQVKKYFQEHFTYTLSPGRVPEGQDVFCYFMEENPQGYCTYFATAAVFIFRNAGIPCRYVEGYSTYVTQGGASDSQETVDSRNSTVFSAEDTYTKYTVPVTDADAHAWVELYMDGFGWIPVDVTPGYQNRQDTAYYAQTEQKSEISMIQAGTETTEEDSDTEVEPHVKDHYDTFAEYMKDNSTGRLDFRIVLPIIGRYLLNLLKILLMITALLCCAGACFFIPERVAFVKRKALYVFSKEQSDKENRKQLLAIYMELEKLGRFYKLPRKPEESYAEYARRLCTQKTFFEKADVHCITRLIMKTAFSQDTLKEEEMENAIFAMVQIRKYSWQELGQIKRIFYKYIWHLA